MDFFARIGLVNLSNVAYISDWTAKLAEKKRDAIITSKQVDTLAPKADGTAPKDFMTKFIELHLRDPRS
jgi:hypothetical protein